MSARGVHPVSVFEIFDFGADLAFEMDGVALVDSGVLGIGLLYAQCILNPLLIFEKVGDLCGLAPRLCGLSSPIRSRSARHLPQAHASRIHGRRLPIGGNPTSHSLLQSLR